MQGRGTPSRHVRGTSQARRTKSGLRFSEPGCPQPGIRTEGAIEDRAGDGPALKMRPERLSFSANPSSTDKFPPLSPTTPFQLKNDVLNRRLRPS